MTCGLGLWIRAWGVREPSYPSELSGGRLLCGFRFTKRWLECDRKPFFRWTWRRRSRSAASSDFELMISISLWWQTFYSDGRGEITVISVRTVKCWWLVEKINYKWGDMERRKHWCRASRWSLIETRFNNPGWKERGRSWGQQQRREEDHLIGWEWFGQGADTNNGWFEGECPGILTF